MCGRAPADETPRTPFAAPPVRQRGAPGGFFLGFAPRPRFPPEISKSRPRINATAQVGHRGPAAQEIVRTASAVTAIARRIHFVRRKRCERASIIVVLFISTRYRKKQNYLSKIRRYYRPTVVFATFKPAHTAYLSGFSGNITHCIKESQWAFSIYCFWTRLRIIGCGFTSRKVLSLR